MTKYIFFNLLLIFLIFGVFKSPAFAFYKQKVLVSEFKDPSGWKSSYSPGKILSDQFRKHMIDEGLFHVLTDKKKRGEMKGEMNFPKTMNEPTAGMIEKNTKIESLDHKSDMKMPPVIGSSAARFHSERASETTPFSTYGFNGNYQDFSDDKPGIRFIDSDDSGEFLPAQGPMMNGTSKMPSKDSIVDEDPVPWPVRLGKIPEKASLFEIKGQVVKFDPGRTSTSTPNKDMEETQKSENAELEVMLQIVKNNTGRIVHEQTFRAFSNSGRRPFSEDIDFRPAKWPSQEYSSMSLALSFLKKELAGYVNKNISIYPLEGEIIALKNENVLINIGRQNGVEVGDRFRVFSVGLKLDDPLTENDLGDIYVKMGVIQVTESMFGSSIAAIIIGKDFLPGNLVQSFQQITTSQQISSGLKTREHDEKIPWWDFRGIKSIP